MAQELQTATKVAFGLFEADLASGELRKSGMRVRLQGLPFKLLRILIEHNNETVSREDLQAQLWSDGTTVDFDHSLGTAVNKLRQALGDTAENPRFIETVARRGYRFIAPLRFLSEATPTPHLEVRRSPDLSAPKVVPALDSGFIEEPPAVQISAKVAAPAVPATLRVPLVSDVPSRSPTASVHHVAVAHRFAWLTLGGFGLLAVVGLCGWLLFAFTGHPAPVRVTQVTFSGAISPGAPDMESLSTMATDGPRVFAPVLRKGAAVLSQISVADGQTTALDLPSEVAGPTVDDISPAGGRLLVRNHLEAQAEQALWIVPTLGGAARRVPNVLAHDATWMPDGQHILFANGTALFVSDESGGDIRRFAEVPGRAFWMRWSPDGSRLRFTLLDPLTHVMTLWEMKRDASGIRALLGNWSLPAGECCGSWTAGGRYFVFQSSKGTGPTGNIWAIDNEHPWLHPAPFQLTNGPLSYVAPVPAREGNGVYFLGLNTRVDLLRYDGSDHMFKPLEREASNMGRTEFSRDGQWMAWINQYDGSLWRSRLDGSERLELTSAPMQVFRMHWSPDDRQLAVMGREPGKPWTVYLIANAGGSSRVLLQENRNQADPEWSPDGRQILMGRLPDLMAAENLPKRLLMVDVATGKVNEIPGSDGLFSPAWSPDGRYVAALPLDQSGVRLYDTFTRTWKTLATRSAADPAWSHDGKWIFFNSFAEPHSPIYRVNAQTGEPVYLTSLERLEGTDVVDYFFSGVTRDDSPLVTARTSTANVYSLDLNSR